MLALRHYLFFSQVVTKLSNMTFNASSESKRSVYDTCDPHYLRQLREAAGIDLVVLARTACLSVAQVRQLETDDSDSLFYSDAIKRQAYKRLLMILGAEPPSVDVPQDLRDVDKVAEAHLNTLDQIVAMSHQPVINRSALDVLVAGFEKVKQHLQFLAALFLLLSAVALFLWNREQSSAVPAAELSSAPASMPVLTATEIAQVPSAPASAVVMGGVDATKVEGCAYSNEGMPQITSIFAKKEGRYIYFVSTVNTEICVVDGNQQATLLQLKAGENRSIYGVSPWQLSGAGVQKLQIYFQGGRVSLPDTNMTRFQLVEVPVGR